MREEKINVWLSQGIFPKSSQFIEVLSDTEKTFTFSEGVNWDFKDTWPDGSEKNYLGGICRLCCAFYNTRGGVVVFGVDDTTRNGGQNRTAVDLDKFSSFFRELTGTSINFEIQQYDCGGLGKVIALFVPARKLSSDFVCFEKGYQKYVEKIIWIRENYEVREANPSHFADMFFRINDEISLSEMQGYLPPNPAQIKKFVGRISVLTELFQWLSQTYEPRKYLWGTGGSGKTTIAYEFARLIKQFGKSLKLEDREAPDLIVYLSAKNRELNPITSSIDEIENPDFSDEETLLRKIIDISGGELDTAEIPEGDMQGLRKVLINYLDAYSYVIILDDVDTLTTDGIDPGSDFLFGALSRAKRTSKILYTVRGAPSQSIVNSINVPRLTQAEMGTFINQCVSRFEVPTPPSDFATKELPQLSDRRPLAIESILAIRRTTDTYKRAAQIYNSNAGDEIREYIFEREWDALSSQRMGRVLLAALSDFGRPVKFDELMAVLRAGENTIRDAISEVKEMFLELDLSGSETLYKTSPLTNSFINKRKTSIKFYSSVRLNVKNFKKTVRISSPELAKISSAVDRLLPKRSRTFHETNISEALRVVQSNDISEQTEADPVFRAYRGFVEAVQTRPNMTRCRQDFDFVVGMKYEPPIHFLSAFFEAEKLGDAISIWPERICQIVIDGKTYSQTDKVSMISRKATTLFNRADLSKYVEPELSENLFQQSLILHCHAFKLNANSGSYHIELSERYARNTALRLIDMAEKSGSDWSVFDRLSAAIKETSGFIDPIEDGVVAFVGRAKRRNTSRSAIARTKSAAAHLCDTINNNAKWLDKSRKEFLIKTLRGLSG